jgi:hypothetical protein
MNKRFKKIRHLDNNHEQANGDFLSRLWSDRCPGKIILESDLSQHIGYLQVYLLTFSLDEKVSKKSMRFASR